ncbi:Putative redox-active protein (C_GCAxxG_C_C) [Clostridiales bacterium CHKCI001]|nr:Putative redox-active protein (C_GCAxxG_C_C) [Clostridiales bacterium CHKCI001]
MTHAEKARELFMEGYNCSQAVVGAFAEELGMEKATAMKLASSFGAGMGRLREVCGTVTGMFLIAGLKYGYSDPKAKEEKASHYKRIQTLAAQFREKNGTIICRELLEKRMKKPVDTNPIPEERTEQYYKQRPCVAVVMQAAEIMEQYINENKKEDL